MWQGKIILTNNIAHFLTFDQILMDDINPISSPLFPAEYSVSARNNTQHES